jgi:prevent-host-death family protein
MVEPMNSATVSIAEGKKGFSRLINDAVEKRENTIVTRRGKPVAVIVPYDEYERSPSFFPYAKFNDCPRSFST